MKTSTVFERNAPAQSVIDHALAGSTRRVFWTEDAPVSASLPPLASGLSADLVIVGAGYTGLWSALLAKTEHPDWRVVVLEGKSAGWAASGRNGGFVESTLTHGEANGRRRFPGDYALLDEAGLANLDQIEQTVHSEQWDCDFWRSGSLQVATEAHQVAWLEDEADGDRTVFLDQAQVRQRVNSPTYLAATFSARDTALVHPAKLTRGLVHSCLARGVEIFHDSPVRSLHADPSAIELRLERATVKAKRVILATNAFPSLLARFRFHTVPVYDYVLMTEPLSVNQRESIGWSGLEGIADSANQFHYYRMSADNRILFGGYDAIYHAGGRIRSRYEERPQSYRRLASHFFTTFPQLEGLRFSHRWAGVIDTCSRFSAFFATAHQGRVAYAAGFTGLGVAATRFAAEVMLDRVQGRTTWRTELEMVQKLPMPFPPEPLTFPVVQTVRAALDRSDHRAGKRGLFLSTLDRLGLGFDS